MLSLPKVSVVMSVFNGARTLQRAVDSILSQAGVELEYIIVNDGSNDGTAQMLVALAEKDGRIKVIHQPNAGLTRALIRGCAEAKGEFIARQDADDVSLPGRLAKQSAFLINNPSVALVSCWTQYIGPEDELLYDVCRKEDPEVATAMLRSGDASSLRGASGHGTAMFHRADYLRAGGYRDQFYFAQDMDLWLRLAELGQLAFVPEVLYQARFGTSDISGKYHREQIALGKLMLQAHAARRGGESETPYLEQAARIRPDGRKSTNRQQAAGSYFIGKMLLGRGDARGRKYLWQAVRICPLHFKAWLSLVLNR